MRLLSTLRDSRTCARSHISESVGENRIEILVNDPHLWLQIPAPFCFRTNPGTWNF